MVDAKFEAKFIIREHTAGMIQATTYEPKSVLDLWEYMGQECGFILADKFLEGKYTPMEYNAIRNEIATLLNDIFEPAYRQEHKCKGN